MINQVCRDLEIGHKGKPKAILREGDLNAILLDFDQGYYDL